MSVGSLRLRLRVPACTVLAAWLLSGGLLGGRGLITGEVLDGGDELTNAELAVALLLRLVVPDVVVVQVGYPALSRGERTRLSVLSGGRLPAGSRLIRPVLRLPLLLAGLLLRRCVLARFELRATRLLEPAGLVLRLFIVAGAARAGPIRTPAPTRTSCSDAVLRPDAYCAAYCCASATGSGLRVPGGYWP